MLQENQTEQALADLSEIRLRLRGLEIALRCFAAGAVLLFGLLAYVETINIPRFEKIFSEMLGSPDVLPGATQFAIGNLVAVRAVIVLTLVAGFIFALRLPGRVHVDPFGNLHICQGISIGNVLERSLSEIMAEYDPDAHPVVGPLVAGGPAELVRRYDLPHNEGYADHCHLCYESRRVLRQRFPDMLTPDQMYGEP